MKQWVLFLVLSLTVGVGVAYAATISEAVVAKFTEQERQYQLPTGVLAKIARAESSGDTCLRNSSSTATGLFQWIEDSWVKATRALYGAPKNLDQRCNPFVATEVTAYALAQFKGNNRALIQQAQANESAALYLSHFLGPAGARKFLTLFISNKTDSASQWFPREARSNPTVFNGKSIAGLYNWAAAKMQEPGITAVSGYAGTYNSSLTTGRIIDSAGEAGLARLFTGPIPQTSNLFSYPSTYTNADAITPINPLSAPASPQQPGGTSVPGQTVSGTPTFAHQVIVQPSSARPSQIVLVSWTSAGMQPNTCSIGVKDQAAFSNTNEGFEWFIIPNDVGSMTFSLTCTAPGGNATAAEAVVLVTP